METVETTGCILAHDDERLTRSEYMGRQETIATDEEWHGWRYEQREWHDTREIYNTI